VLQLLVTEVWRIFANLEPGNSKLDLFAKIAPCAEMRAEALSWLLANCEPKSSTAKNNPIASKSIRYLPT
jgi:hypothetical protein